MSAATSLETEVQKTDERSSESKKQDFRGIVDRLCEVSRNVFTNPHTALEWPESIGDDAWCMSPELVSIYGTPAYDALDDMQRRKLAFFEAVNFFSLNINGEKALLEGLTKRLYSRDRPELSAYIHHFVDEENKHMLYFGTFCQRYAGKTYPDKKLVLTGNTAPREADLLFFLKVLVFEELVDVYNVRMAKDERLPPVVRRINLLHHQDETRHLVFGRMLVKQLWDDLAPTLPKERLTALREYTTTYLQTTWREYYNPEVYRDAGLAEPYRVYQAALASDVTRAHRKDVSEKVVRFLLEIGVFIEEPSL